ncbi:MAG: winged helix-turn-helix domain-containing protein [Methanosarcina sp.]|uniref:helix-turn-helix transcriptional regulator n=1 Tax=Methanosarcina sp. TaxID=2213 RepID=UPI002606941A|nr:winged helix-turn-helix domain-containing protein [Methanosarcina sp.]MDD3245302.1 winged helix-turn-helix domain-containing protein [Methanosarcina sp.]MDD4248514.1 winged helix-turn-helix domain-containing protein [Methanosarcina sp.]
MESSLIDLVFRSDKRKNLLILLDSGSKNIDEIKNELDVTATSILPQIKKLIDSDLIVQEDRMYKLTVLGEFIIKKVKPLISALQVVEKNNCYWTGHDLNSIPHHLLERISELGDCILVEPDLNHIYEPSQKIIDSMANAKMASTLASYFNPAYLPLYVELGRKEAELSLNFTQSVWDHLSKEHSNMIKELMSMDNVSLYISKEGIKISEITVTDKIMLLGLFDKNGKFDQQFILSFEPSALRWGQELFDYFKRLSKQVNKI